MAQPTALRPLTQAKVDKLNSMCQKAKDAELGTILREIIDFLNALLEEAIADGFTS